MAAQFHCRIIVKMGGVAKTASSIFIAVFRPRDSSCTVINLMSFSLCHQALSGRDVKILGTAVYNKSFGDKHFYILPFHVGFISKPACFFMVPTNHV